jgi:hypothetical protein
MFPGGGYGYGVYDPLTHVFMALTAHQMVVNDMAMMEAGYGRWGQDGRPVDVHHNSGVTFLYILIGIVIVVVIIVVISRFL